MPNRPERRAPQQPARGIPAVGIPATVHWLAFAIVPVLLALGLTQQSIGRANAQDEGEEQAHAEHLFPDEPPAHALYDEMVRTLQQADSFSCQGSYRWESRGQDLGRATFKLWLKKPGRARFEGYHAGKLTGTLVGDGQQFWIFWPERRPMFASESAEEYEKSGTRVYMHDVVSADKYSIAHQTVKLGAGICMPVLQPSIFHGNMGSLEPYLDAVRGLGTEEIAGEMCDMIEVGYMKGQRSKFFWIARRDHVPRKLKEVVRVGIGDIISEEEWSQVVLNQEIPADKFSWSPPADWSQWKLPDMGQGLLAAGTEAPGFEQLSRDGQSIKLEDFRGKVVWLVFWRIGCPPCRVEFPVLEHLYRDFASQGLVVLGYNCSDEKTLVENYLKEKSITFPNIVDTSESAVKVCFEQYQKPGSSGVPLNYILDKEGRVAASWYGYQKDDKTAMNVLEKLGIK